jgi:hypothetical protein
MIVLFGNRRLFFECKQYISRRIDVTIYERVMLSESHL